jgi:hypothetical protein
MPVQPQNIALKMEDEKASLVAAFFQGTKPTPPVKVRKESRKNIIPTHFSIIFCC